MITVGDELTLNDEPLRVKKADEHIVVFDRLNPPPPARSWVPEPKVYVITTARVDELLTEGAMVPTAVTQQEET